MKRTVVVAAFTALAVAIPAAAVTTLLITPPMPTSVQAPGPREEAPKPTPFMSSEGRAGIFASPSPESPTPGAASDAAAPAPAPTT